jgi:hypothetical protein
MPDFHPETDSGLSLREALMRAGNPLLAVIAHMRLKLGEQPHWWMPQLAPEPRLERYAKYDYVDPKKNYELTVQAVETAFRIQLINGELTCWARPGAPHESHKKLARSAWWALIVEDWLGGTLRSGTRDERMDFVPVPDGLRYYDAKIEPLLSRRPVSEADLRDWIARNLDIGDRHGVPLAEQELGGQVPHERYREVRRALAKDMNIELKPGKRRQT